MAKIKVWSKQHENVWKVLQETGRYTVKREYIIKDLKEHSELVLDTYDIDETYYINKISHTSGETTQEMITRLWLTPMMHSLDALAFVLDSTDSGLLDTNKLAF